MPSSTIEQMGRVFDEALDLARRKNADYGDAWRDQGWRGNLSRILEKAGRLRNLLWRGSNSIPIVDEDTRQTMLDIINTAAFFIINKDHGVEWGHETPYPTPLPLRSPGESFVDNGQAWGPGTPSDFDNALSVGVPGEEKESDQRPTPHKRKVVDQPSKS